MKAVWDEHFSKHPKPAAVLELLTSVVGNRQQLFFGITLRDLMRTSRQQDLERRFRELGLMDDTFGWDPFQKEEKPKHKSRLLRVLTVCGHMFQDPHDTFLATYASKRPEFSSLEVPHKAKLLVDELTNESERDSHGKEDGPPAQ